MFSKIIIFIVSYLLTTSVIANDHVPINGLIKTEETKVLEVKYRPSTNEAVFTLSNKTKYTQNVVIVSKAEVDSLSNCECSVQPLLDTPEFKLLSIINKDTEKFYLYYEYREPEFYETDSKDWIDYEEEGYDNFLFK
jgi:hypothetical protein